jgi:ABC-type transport system substrate-binding protein
MNERGILACISIVMLFMITNLPLGVKAVQVGNQWTGPWVDKIVYRVMPNESDRFLALIDGDVDIIGGRIGPSFFDIQWIENIGAAEFLKLGYGIVEINCAKYPMNITNFRRAVAFALDKNRIIEEGWRGLAQLLDCHIPRQHPASIEDEMEYHYYDKQIESGAELLTQEGFVDSDDDGWLEGPGPKGAGTIELESIVVEGHAIPQVEVYVETMVQALLDLGINAEAGFSSIRDYDPRHRIFYHGDYDMLFHEKEWSDFDLDFYARDMLTKYIRTPFYNLPNWSNATWDTLASTVLHSTDYDEILEAAKQMEHIWVHSCPAIVLFQPIYFTVFRTDRFENVTPTILEGAPNFFTNLRVRPNDGVTFGGTFTWANPTDILSFNHFSLNSIYADKILMMLFDSLIRIDPEGNDILWMCESYTVKTHEDNPRIQENHTRIIVDVVQNATWNDGTPITAEDFAFSLKFMRDHVPVAGSDLVDMVTCYAPTTYELFCEFKTESYWHWHAIAYKSVIPNQIWLEYADACDEYQPSPDTLSAMILSGPFLPITWKQGEYTELVQNPLYFRNPRHFMNLTSTNTILDNETSQFIFELSLQNLSLLTAGVAYSLIIIVFAVDFIRNKRREGG